jgi:hypothetical protein
MQPPIAARPADPCPSSRNEGCARFRPRRGPASGSPHVHAAAGEPVLIEAARRMWTLAACPIRVARPSPCEGLGPCGRPGNGGWAETPRQSRHGLLGRGGVTPPVLSVRGCVRRFGGVGLTTCLSVCEHFTKVWTPLKFSSTSLLQIICEGGVGMQFSSVEIYCFSALRAGAVGCWVNPLC